MGALKGNGYSEGRSPGRRAPIGLAFALAFLGLISPGNGLAQTVYYADQASFLIPVYPDPNDKKTQAILLHVSEDMGRTYQFVATAGVLQKTFNYKAPRDGWYWFAVQTQESGGTLKPATMASAQALLKVCVDTQAPSIILRQGAMTKDGSLGVDWEIRDDSLDLASMRLEYRLLGAKDWIPLPAQQLQQGSYAWNPATPSPLEVRLSVRDRAKNLGEQILAVGLKNGQTAPSGATGDGRTPIIMVRSKRFALNYRIEDVGPSDVTRVEVHYTRDGGRTWRKYDADAPKDPPCILEVPEEGRYGFTLIARSGVDLSEQPPRPGDPPHVWVEVDETKPLIRLIGVEVGRGPESGTMTVNWTASDKFLGSSPIAISYSQTAEGPWTEIARDLPNNGKFVWKMPPQGLPFAFFVRASCNDLAGNQGLTQTTAAVKVDLSLPKARINSIDIAPVDGAVPVPPSVRTPTGFANPGIPGSGAIPMDPPIPAVSSPMLPALPPGGSTLPSPTQPDPVSMPPAPLINMPTAPAAMPPTPPNVPTAPAAMPPIPPVNVPTAPATMPPAPPVNTPIASPSTPAATPPAPAGGLQTTPAPISPMPPGFMPPFDSVPSGEIPPSGETPIPK